MPVPQENSLFVEQAGKPVLENGARCEFEPTLAMRRGINSLLGVMGNCKSADTISEPKE